MKSRKITSLNPYVTSINQKYVTAKDYNYLKEDLDALRPSDTEMKADTISEVISAAGVTIDGVLIKDNTLTALKKSVTEASGAAVTLTAAMSGKVFFINSDSGATTYTLPAPSAGLHYKWIVTADTTSATIIKTADITDTTGDMLRGGLLVCSAAAVNTFVEAAADVNTLTLDDNVNNAGQGIGSWIEIICTEDPTWFITGVLNGNTDADGTGSALFTDADA
jgi:hypothetical protein